MPAPEWAKRAHILRWFQIIYAVSAIVWQIAYAAADSAVYVHFTAWSWTVQAVYLAASLSHTLELHRNVVTHMLPATFAYVTFVAIGSIYIIAKNAQIIRDAKDDYPNDIVWGVNFWMHYVPLIMVYLHNVSRRDLHVYHLLPPRVDLRHPERGRDQDHIFVRVFCRRHPRLVLRCIILLRSKTTGANSQAKSTKLIHIQSAN